MSEIGSNTSVETESLNVLSADNPLTDPNDDELGYAPFAENLAKSICKMSPPDGLVMAVYAPWGSGKSTLLNFIIHYLEQKPKSPISLKIYNECDRLCTYFIKKRHLRLFANGRCRLSPDVEPTHQL